LALRPRRLHVETFARKEREGFIERQSHDVGVGADHLLDEAAGNALDGIGTGLTAPLAGSDVAVNFPLRQSLEAHLGLDHLLAELAARSDQADAGIDPMAA